MTTQFSGKRWTALPFVTHLLPVAAICFLATEVTASETAPPADSFSEVFAEGKLEGQIGVGINAEDNQNLNNSGFSWGYIEAKYTTATWNGLKAGGSFLGVTKIWENHSGDYSSVFTEDLDLQELFLDYRNEEETLGALIGRATMPSNPGLDGDYQQGVNLHAGSAAGYSIDLSVINRWIKYSTYNYDRHGITGWDDIDAVNGDAGELFFASVVQIPVGENFSVSPYLNYQDDVMIYYGATFNASVPTDSLAEKSYWETNLILAIYDNQVPKAIEPDYEDARGGLLYTGLAFEEYTLGGGIYWISDDTINTGAGAFNIFDPLKQDDLYPYNDENDMLLFYLKASAQWGNLTVYPAVGIGRNYAVDSDSLELDLLLRYDLPGNFVLEGYLIYVEFEDSTLANYSIGGATIGYNF
tara:strand:+ start:23398 stop:24636 length:1239 start_codon:yes stop_codon:yes gene_type:complete